MENREKHWPGSLWCEYTKDVALLTGQWNITKCYQFGKYENEAHTQTWIEKSQWTTNDSVENSFHGFSNDTNWFFQWCVRVHQTWWCLYTVSLYRYISVSYVSVRQRIVVNNACSIDRVEFQPKTQTVCKHKRSANCHVASDIVD